MHPTDNASQDEGSYVLRTDRTDLSDEKIWEIYIMLGNIEYSWLTMKSYLGLRPDFHQKEDRVDTHMFISVLAYHILHIIEYRLRLNNDHRKYVFKPVSESEKYKWIGSVFEEITSDLVLISKPVKSKNGNYIEDGYGVTEFTVYTFRFIGKYSIRFNNAINH